MSLPASTPTPNPSSFICLTTPLNAIQKSCLSNPLKENAGEKIALFCKFYFNEGVLEKDSSILYQKGWENNSASIVNSAMSVPTAAITGIAASAIAGGVFRSQHDHCEKISYSYRHYDYETGESSLVNSQKYADSRIQSQQDQLMLNAGLIVSGVSFAVQTIAGAAIHIHELVNSPEFAVWKTDFYQEKERNALLDFYRKDTYLQYFTCPFSGEFPKIPASVDGSITVDYESALAWMEKNPSATFPGTDKIYKKTHLYFDYAYSKAFVIRIQEIIRIAQKALYTAELYAVGIREWSPEQENQILSPEEAFSREWNRKCALAFSIVKHHVGLETENPNVIRIRQNLQELTNVGRTLSHDCIIQFSEFSRRVDRLAQSNPESACVRDIQKQISTTEIFEEVDGKQVPLKIAVKVIQPDSFTQFNRVMCNMWHAVVNGKRRYREIETHVKTKIFLKRRRGIETTNDRLPSYMSSRYHTVLNHARAIGQMQRMQRSISIKNLVHNKFVDVPLRTQETSQQANSTT